MLSKILGILPLQQLSLINAAPGQILSRPRAGDDPGVFYCPPVTPTPRSFRSILCRKTQLNKDLFCSHGGE